MLTPSQIADLRKLVLFKFIYWKIAKLKLASRFKQAIRDIRTALKTELTVHDFDKLMKNDRYIQKGKKVLLSRSFELPSLAVHKSPKNKKKISKSPPSRRHSRDAKPLLQMLANKLHKQPQIKEMDLFIFQKLREKSGSASDWEQPSQADDKIQASLLAANDSLRSARNAEADTHGKNRKNNRHNRMATMPPRRLMVKSEMTVMSQFPSSLLKEGQVVRKRRQSKLLRSRGGGMPSVPNESKIPRPRSREMVVIPKSKRIFPEIEGFNFDLNPQDTEVAEIQLQENQNLNTTHENQRQNPVVLRAMTGLADNFHVLVTEAELKQTAEQLDPRNILAMLNGKSDKDHPVDDQIFVLLLKNYFFNHSKLRSNVEKPGRIIEPHLRTVMRFLDKHDSHLVQAAQFEIDDDDFSEIEFEALFNQKSFPEPSDPVGLGDDFLDDDRASVQSMKFPTYNMNPNLHCELDPYLAIKWVEVEISYKNKLKAVKLKTNAFLQKIRPQLVELSFNLNYHKRFGPSHIE